MCSATATSSPDKPAFAGPEEALARPREALTWWLPLMRKLGFPEPDPWWQTTAQVEWERPVPFGVRFLCLYLGHTLVKRRLRPGENTHRRICERCGWEGPWTR